MKRLQQVLSQWPTGTSMLCMIFSISCIILAPLKSDEGMWLFDQIPLQQIQQQYGKQLNQADLDHIRLSCLRLSAGGSASFVSPQGLIMTNHHVSFKTILDLSSADQNFVTDGFYAQTLNDELPCPNLYADQLCEIHDVTAEILAALPEREPSAREQAYHACVANLIQREKEATGLQPEIVTLYGGARYHLYLYRRYTDIRLVMSPESSIAYLGGDAENFEFPRHCLDLCFMRIYDNDKPLGCDHYLPWSSNGPQEGELLFVAGHPGRTERQITAEHLHFLKTCKLPLIMYYLNDKIDSLAKFTAQSSENERIASSELRRCLNAWKVYSAQTAILDDTSLLLKKNEEQKEFAHLSPWQELSTMFQAIQNDYPAFFYYEGIGSNHSRLFRWARQLVRFAAEKEKPDSERLREYRESALATLELDLLSTEPTYEHFEQFSLQSSFMRAAKALADNALALEAIDASTKPTQLADAAYRKYLYEHPEELKSCCDPLILLAAQIDPYSRQIRQKQEQMETIMRDCYAKIANTLQLAESTYPDATFTLRLSVGQMIGYEEDGRNIPATTTFGSAFTHSQESNLPLPNSWQDAMTSVNPETPFNFVSTNDIIGGNSGSPVINAAGEVVGLIFDGNAQSLAWDLAFDQQQGRAVSVHSGAIVEALEKVYHADRIVKEITSHANSLQ